MKGVMNKSINTNGGNSLNMPSDTNRIRTFSMRINFTKSLSMAILVTSLQSHSTVSNRRNSQNRL